MSYGMMSYMHPQAMLLLLPCCVHWSSLKSARLICSLNGEQLHLQAVPEAEVASGKQGEASSVESKESAAGKLVRQYGHLDKGSGRKRKL